MPVERTDPIHSSKAIRYRERLRTLAFVGPVSPFQADSEVAAGAVRDQLEFVVHGTLEAHFQWRIGKRTRVPVKPEP